jgi:internalin A
MTMNAPLNLLFFLFSWLALTRVGWLRALRRRQSVRKIKGNGLAVLKSLQALKSLSLNGTRITDESLKHLLGVKNLTILLLNDTDESDDGTTTLALLPQLEWLYLNRTKVTDASMQKLGDLHELRFLSLLGTSVTDSGVADLHALVPSVRVRR